jgi:hypothetical protein
MTNLIVFMIVAFIIGIAGMVAVPRTTALVSKQWGRRKAKVFFVVAGIVDVILFSLLIDHLSIALLM